MRVLNILLWPLIHMLENDPRAKLESELEEYRRVEHIEAGVDVRTMSNYYPNRTVRKRK